MRTQSEPTVNIATVTSYMREREAELHVYAVGAGIELVRSLPYHEVNEFGWSDARTLWRIGSTVAPDGVHVHKLVVGGSDEELVVRPTDWPQHWHGDPVAVVGPLLTLGGEVWLEGHRVLASSNAAPAYLRGHSEVQARERDALADERGAGREVRAVV